jgi:UDP:flavonoid glycosyltransferase YjiC (YdhE family)
MGVPMRILFLAEGATLAHFARPVALADSLVPYGEEYDIHLYAPARFASHLSQKTYHTGELKTAPEGDFLKNIARGKPMFSNDVLRSYVQEDCRLIRSLRPDIVIGDMRLSLSISARLERVPFAVIMNAYWSPYAKPRSIIPELPLTRIISPRLLGPLYRSIEPVAFAIHVAQMNRLRKEFGIVSLPLDLRKMYTDGDYVLYPDVPEFLPTGGAPSNHCYVGTCSWAPDTVQPEWWKRMLSDPKPKVFISLGSSGPITVLPQLLEVLTRLPVSIVLATSGRFAPPVDANIYACDLLPFTEMAGHSALVVTQGGSGGVYSALTAGTPVLAIPSNADQHLSTAVLEENGAGLGVRAEEASSKHLRSALQELFSKGSYSAVAKRWSAIFRKDQTTNRFREFLRGLA